MSHALKHQKSFVSNVNRTSNLNYPLTTFNILRIKIQKIIVNYNGNFFLVTTVGKFMDRVLTLAQKGPLGPLCPLHKEDTITGCSSCSCYENILYSRRNSCITQMFQSYSNSGPVPITDP